MGDELVCPYCGREQEGHEPDEISANMCLTKCEHCDKPFSGTPYPSKGTMTVPSTKMMI